jgi:hypothetical protein
VRTNIVLSSFAALVVAPLFLEANAQTVQTAADVFDSRPFLWLEAEDYSSLGEDPENDGWKVVTKENPVTSTQGLPILPPSTNASGAALLDDVGGGGHSDTAQYEVQFITAGTYQLYTRHSMYDSPPGNNTYGNEDSVYLSPAFNKNSNSDWVGFEGLEFDETDPNADVPTPGLPLDPDGYKPSMANDENDGWYALRDWGVKSEGDVNLATNDATSDLWNGNFNWYNRPVFVSTNEGGGFDSDFGFKTEYVVTPAMVGQTLTFEIGTREPYGVFDGFLFIEDNNLDLLDMFSQEEVDAGIFPQPVNGDYNNNRAADAADYVLWRNGGPLENDATAGVQPADYEIWRAAFGAGSGSGAALGAGAVPEPASLALVVFGFIAFLAAQRRSGR